MKSADILTSRGRKILRGRFQRAVAVAFGRAGTDERARAWAAEHERLRAAIVPENPAIPSRGRKKNLEEHLDALAPEFAGRSELCFHHARLCVKARRGLDPVDTIDEFLFLWETQASHLAGHLNSRWLLSAVDTFADYGTSQQRAIAGMLTAFFNALKMAETENSVLHGIPERDALVHVTEPEPEEFWDGIEGFRFHKGDMLRNLMERMDRVSKEDTALHAIFQVLVRRAFEHNSPLARMMRANRFFGDSPTP